MRLSRIVVAVTMALLATACGGDEPGATVRPTNTPGTTGTEPTTSPTTSGPSRTGRTVDVVDNAYVPAELTVTVGTEVIWNYVGPDAPHTVTATNGSFDSNPECDTSKLDQCLNAVGDSFRHTFSSAGSFTYSCKIHGELMSGTVIIE